MTILILLVQLLITVAILFVLHRSRLLAQRIDAQDAAIVNLAKTLDNALATVQFDIEANASLMTAMEQERERQRENDERALFARRDAL